MLWITIYLTIKCFAKFTKLSIFLLKWLVFPKLEWWELIMCTPILKPWSEHLFLRSANYNANAERQKYYLTNLEKDSNGRKPMEQPTLTTTTKSQAFRKLTKSKIMNYNSFGFKVQKYLTFIYWTIMEIKSILHHGSTSIDGALSRLLRYIFWVSVRFVSSITV